MAQEYDKYGDSYYSQIPTDDKKYECRTGPFEGFFLSSVEFCKHVKFDDRKDHSRDDRTGTQGPPGPQGIQGIQGENGVRVDAFNDPVLALENYKVNYYDLVILDIKMPRIDGFQLYDKLRQKDPKVKICFLTASEMYYKEFRDKHSDRVK